MNPVWFVVGACVVAALVALVVARLRGYRQADLGAVSHQWIAEHRLGQGHDRRN
jgi:hypothetical protein